MKQDEYCEQGCGHPRNRHGAAVRWPQDRHTVWCKDCPDGVCRSRRQRAMRPATSTNRGASGPGGPVNTTST